MNYEGEIASPFDKAPAPGVVTAVAPGMFWLRLPVPLRLNHVNVYLIEDDGGVAIVDTGMGTDETRAIWRQIIDDWLKGRPVTRVIVTHYHPDHVGCAGWLTERTGAPLLMSEIEYLATVSHQLGRFRMTRENDRAFYLRNGLEEETIEGFMTRGPDYLMNVAPISPAYTRLRAGDSLTIGGRRFELFSGAGHSDDQIMLYCAEAGVFIAADQVMTGITPNIGVWPSEPNAPALDLFLQSLSEIKTRAPRDVFVLAGHKLPFFGLHERIDQLARHHAAICERIVAICEPQSVQIVEMIPKLFDRELNAHHTVLAFVETLAHVNHLVGRGVLRWESDRAGRSRVKAA